LIELVVHCNIGNENRLTVSFLYAAFNIQPFFYSVKVFLKKRQQQFSEFPLIFNQKKNNWGRAGIWNLDLFSRDIFMIWYFQILPLSLFYLLIQISISSRWTTGVGGRR